jgi:hypothetical protein
MKGTATTSFSLIEGHHEGFIVGSDVPNRLAEQVQQLAGLTKRVY